ncbi:hypothetical protein N431DRAFT_440893 [Stipitochalara longipes BDJ]|nr:hypothetical protein N431DRAFT_440893 [Stipitochalara longipes BDJ]
MAVFEKSDIPPTSYALRINCSWASALGEHIDADLPPEFTAVDRITACTGSLSRIASLSLFTWMAETASPDVDRMLLNRMACAGGLAILRAAAQIANGASLLRQPARILGYACELCTPNFRLVLDNAANKRSTDFFSAIYFGDRAAAFVLCNDFAPEARGKAVFQLVN